MASLIDLPNELIVAIASLLQKPYEILQLILVNGHLYQTCLYLLYRHIILNWRAAYRSSPKSVLTNYQSRQVGQGYPHRAITRLSSLLSKPGVYHGSGVHVLDLRLELNTQCPDFGLRALLPHLHNLRHFRLSIEKALNLDGESQITKLSARSLGSALDPVRKTLKSLCIYTEHDRAHRDGSNIGDLRHYTSLESLSIQCHILFGQKSKSSPRALQQILPLSIQQLFFDCRADDVGETSWRHALNVTAKRAETICSMLENLLIRMSGALQGLRKITLLLGYPFPHRVDLTNTNLYFGYPFPKRIANLFKRWDDVQEKVLERGIRLELRTFRPQVLLTTNTPRFQSDRRPDYLDTPLT